MAKGETEKTQITIQELSKRIKDQLNEGIYKKSKEEIEVTKQIREQMFEINKRLDDQMDELEREARSKKTSKKRLKGIEKEIKEIQSNYKDPEKAQNIINKQSGKPFYFTINLYGFPTPVKGKQQKTLRVSSTQFKNKDPGEIERMLLKKWVKSIERSIKETDNEVTIEALEKIKLSVQDNIDLIDGIITVDDLEDAIKDEKDYPILVDINPNTAYVQIQLSGTKKKKKAKK